MRYIRSIAIACACLIGGVAPAQDQASLAPTLGPPPITAPATGATTVPMSGSMGSHALTKGDVDAWLDGYMPYALRTGDIAGAVVTVVKDGQVLTARGFGYADIAKRKPVDPEHTLFRPGSVSKLVTWTAIMQLVELGKLDLDRDVNAYLDFKIPPRDGRPVTLRQILTHTGGFEEAGKNTFLPDAKQLRPISAYLKDWTPRRIFAPGTTPAYSNWATTLAGYIVERTSGMPFDDYVERNIFAPIGMRHSTFRQPLPARLAPFMATGYPRASQPAKPFEIIQVGPAGSLSASGLDMARFMIAHLGNGRGLLQPQTAALMHNSPLDKVNPKSLIPPLNRMELGFFQMNVNGHENVGHLGDTENFHTSLNLFTNDGVGLYLSVNSAGKDGAAHPLRVSLVEDFADRYFPAPKKDARVDAKTAAAHARMMAGLWEGSRTARSSFLRSVYLIGQTKVSVGPKGELVIPSLQGANGAPRQWVEVAPFVWRERDGHERLAAQLANGEVVRWSTSEASPFLVFDRVPFARSTAWILPPFYVGLGILALTFLYWPVAWYIRRRYGAKLAVAGGARQAYRATRIMSGLDLLMLGGWTAFMSALLSGATNTNNSSDPWLWLLQILGWIVFVGAVLVSGWNLWLTWRDGRRWTRKAWSLLVFLATLIVFYVALTFGLLAMTVNY